MYELQVEGMSCAHCVGAVTKSIRTVDAEAKVEIDLASKKVRVDSDANLEALAAAIADAGYSVSSSTAT